MNRIAYQYIKKNFLNIAIFTSFFLFIFLLFYRPIETEDIWWHLSTGRWIIEHGQAPQEDIFSLVQPHFPWTFPQWLGSTILYSIYYLSGLGGLIIFRDLIFIIIIGIYIWYAKPKIPLWAIITLGSLLAFGLETRLLLRPFIFNYIFIQIFLIQLLKFQNSSNLRNLIIIPILGVFWHNIHLGGFIYANLLISVFLFYNLVELFILKSSHKSQGSFKQTQIRVKFLFIILLAHLAVQIINPYGVKGLLYPYQFFLIPSFINFHFLVKTINELQAPIYLFTTFSGIWAIILFLIGTTMLILNNKTKLLYFLLFTASVFMFIVANRESAFFAIISVFIITECASNTGVLTGWENKPSFRKSLHALHFILCFILILVCWHLYNQKTYINNRFINNLSLIYEPRNPLSAIKFLKDNNIQGTMFNSDSLGGFLIWDGYPNKQVFIDTRQDNKDLFVEYIKIVFNPQIFWPIAEAKYNFNIVLLDLTNSAPPQLIDYFRQSKNWQLSFVDGNCAIFLKRGEPNFSNIRPHSFIQGQKPELATEKDWGNLNELFKRSKSPNIIKLILSPYPKYVEPLETGINLIELGYSKTGIDKILEADGIADPRKLKQVSKSVLATKNYFKNQD